MTDSSAHAYAAGLVQSGTPVPHAARMSGLSTADIGYLRPRQRQAYIMPVPTEPLRVLNGNRHSREVFFASCKRLNVDPQDVMGDSRKRSIAWPRQEIMFDLFTQCPKLGLMGVGRLTGRDHTTVLHGIKKHCERIGISYEEAVAMRIKAHNDSGTSLTTPKHPRINQAVFMVMMEKYGASMRGNQ